MAKKWKKEEGTAFCVSNGRDRLGTIHRSGNAYIARDASGDQIGAFASNDNAVRAICNNQQGHGAAIAVAA